MNNFDSRSETTLFESFKTRIWPNGAVLFLRIVLAALFGYYFECAFLEGSYSGIHRVALWVISGFSLCCLFSYIFGLVDILPPKEETEDDGNVFANIPRIRSYLLCLLRPLRCVINPSLACFDSYPQYTRSFILFLMPIMAMASSTYGTRCLPIYVSIAVGSGFLFAYEDNLESSLLLTNYMLDAISNLWIASFVGINGFINDVVGVLLLARLGQVAVAFNTFGGRTLTGLLDLDPKRARARLWAYFHLWTTFFALSAEIPLLGAITAVCISADPILVAVSVARFFAILVADLPETLGILNFIRAGWTFRFPWLFGFLAALPFVLPALNTIFLWTYEDYGRNIENITCSDANAETVPVPVSLPAAIVLFAFLEGGFIGLQLIRELDAAEISHDSSATVPDNEKKGVSNNQVEFRDTQGSLEPQSVSIVTS